MDKVKNIHIGTTIAKESHEQTAVKHYSYHHYLIPFAQPLLQQTTSTFKMVDVIGLVSGVLTIVNFIQSQIPDRPKEGVAVRIKAGSGGTDDEGSVRSLLAQTAS